MATTKVFNGVDGKITFNSVVIGGCNSGEIRVTRNVAEFAEIGSNWASIAGGHATAEFTINGAWAGSRWLPFLTMAGSGFDLILENSGTTSDDATMIASGCIASEGTWSQNAGEISSDSISGRCVLVYASGSSYN